MLIQPRHRIGTRAAVIAIASGLVLGAVPLPSWGPGSAAAQQTADVTLEGLSFGMGGVVYRAPRVEFKGTPLSRAELERLMSSASGLQPAARISAVTAREIVMPEVVSELVGPQGRQVTTYRDVVFRNVAAGRIASVTAASGLFSAPTVTGQAEGTFGRFSIDDVDLGLAVSLFTDKATSGAAALKRLYGAFSLDALSMPDKDGAMLRIARMSGRDFSARPTREGWAGALETLSKNPDIAAAPPEDRKRAFAVMAEIMDAFEIGLLEMTGFEFKSGKTGEGDGKIGRIAFTGGSGGRPGEIQVDAIELAMPDGTIKIGGMAFGGMSLKPLFEGLQNVAATAPEEMSPGDMRKLLPLVGNLRLSGMDVDMPGDPGEDGKPGPRVRFALGGVEIVAEKPLEGLPTDVRLAFRNVVFVVPPTADNDGAKQLRSLGYERVDMSLAASLGWDAAGQQILLRDLSLNGADMGGVVIRGVVGNVPKDVFNPDTAVAMVALIGATARSLDITVENRGLADRILRRDAAASGRPVEELRREYGSMAALGVPMMLGNSAAAKSIGQAVARFIAKPGRLVIQARAKSAAGLGIGDLAVPDPTAVLNLLDVTATSE